MFGEKSCFVKRGIVVVGILFIATVILAIGVTADGNPVYVDDDAGSGWYNATHVRTIQEGINNVSAGGTVYVWNGTYCENVIVNKSITLEANSSSVLDGMGGYGMNVTVNSTVVKNITVTNCTVSIYTYNSSCVLHDITFSSLTVSNSTSGICFDNATCCNVTYCNVSNSTCSGIIFGLKQWPPTPSNSFCSHCNVLHCNISSTQNGMGVDIRNVSYCNVSHNEIFDMGYSGGGPPGIGICISNSYHNDIYCQDFCTF